MIMKTCLANLKRILMGTAASFALVLSSTAAGPFVSDDFTSGSLATPPWTFVNPLGNSTAVVVDQVLQITVPLGGPNPLLPPDKNAARVMQAVDDTDFEVEVKFDSAPSQQYQEQGLIVDQDADNYLAFEVYSDGATVNALVRNVAGGGISYPVAGQLLGAQAHYYLRVGRVGDTWTFEYSYNGVDWGTAGSFSQSLVVSQVGVYAAVESAATSSGFTASVDYVLNTAPIVPVAPQITSATLPATGTVGTPYNYTVTATGTAPITFTASGLPGGLAISSAGAITGAPLTAGTFTGTITAANGTLPNATQSFSIVISAATVAPTITSAAPTATGTVGTPYNFTVTATGTAPIKFTASGLPTGLTISSAGAITGTPTTAGTFTGTITAANGTLPNATQSFSIVIKKAVVANLPPVVGIVYPFTGSRFIAGKDIVLTALAGDRDGSVKSVEFFAGATSLGIAKFIAFGRADDQSAKGIYVLVWRNVRAGQYNLTARAVDNAGASTNSKSVGISVIQNPREGGWR